MRKNLVVQANALIEAHYKQTYTVQEMRTVLWLISEVHKEDFFSSEKYVHKAIEITAKKYSEIMGIHVDNVYRDAEKIATSLGSKRFTIKTPTGWINLGWISSMEYKRGEGIIRVLIAPDLIPYITQLKQYTSFCLENILNICSSHAIKLYQLLVQHKGIGERTIELDELRLMLGINGIKSYAAYKSLKQRVIEISKREINDKTDFIISYSEIKKGRKVEAIQFKITQKPKEEEINNNSKTKPNKNNKTTQTQIYKIKLSTLEEAKQLALAAGTRWDIYAIEEQFYIYINKVGNPENIDYAFLGFVKKKIQGDP